MKTNTTPSLGMNSSNIASKEQAERRLHESAAAHGKLKVIGDYVNNKTRVDVECLSCGKQWDIYPKNVHAGNGCKSCAHKVPAEELERRRIAKELDRAERSAARTEALRTAQQKRVFETAAKFSSRGEWQKACKYTYELASKLGCKEQACAHMEYVQRPQYTKEECLELAKQCTTRGQFLDLYPGASSCARKNGWHDECCEHMAARSAPKDGAPSQVYVMEHLLDDGRTIINIGVTTRQLNGRYGKSELATTRQRQVIPFLDGTTAWEVEKQTHRLLKGKALDTTVDQLPKKNGKDELYEISFTEAVLAVAQAEQQVRSEATAV